MKNIENIIKYQTEKIEINNLKVINYLDKNNIKCKCNKCQYEIIGKYIPLEMSILKFDKFNEEFFPKDLSDLTDILKGTSLKFVLNYLPYTDADTHSGPGNKYLNDKKLKILQKYGCPINWVQLRLTKKNVINYTNPQSWIDKNEVLDFKEVVIDIMDDLNLNFSFFEDSRYAESFDNWYSFLNYKSFVDVLINDCVISKKTKGGIPSQDYLRSNVSDLISKIITHIRKMGYDVSINNIDWSPNRILTRIRIENK